MMPMQNIFAQQMRPPMAGPGGTPAMPGNPNSVVWGTARGPSPLRMGGPMPVQGQPVQAMPGQMPMQPGQAQPVAAMPGQAPLPQNNIRRSLGL